jgi:hypothetical protein
MMSHAEGASTLCESFISGIGDRTYDRSMKAATFVHICCSILVLVWASLARSQEPAKPDWKPVGEVLGHPGKVLSDGTFRVDVPRTTPQLRNEFGFVVPPSMVLTYAAFAGTPADATVVGDTCMLGEEVNPVIDALRAGKMEIVAIHNHMLGGTPNFIFLHFQGKGEALGLARTIRKAWDEMQKEHALPKRAHAEAPKPDWKAISEIVGLPGALQEDGMYKITLPRPQLGTGLDGRTLPAGVGLACWVGFAPCECGLTMIMGDTCLLRTELQRAIDGYRRAGIRIVAIHNHVLGSTPEVIFCHFSAEGDAAELARAIRENWSGLIPPK